MTKINKLQNEYPAFTFTLRPASDPQKKAYLGLGLDEPKNMLWFSYDNMYTECIGDYEWSIKTLRNNIDRWYSKI